MQGFHVSREEWLPGGTLAECVAAARGFHASLSDAGFAFQVFVAGPKSTKFVVSAAEAEGLALFLRAEQAAGRPLWGVAHGSYLDAPWGGAPWVARWIRTEQARARQAGLAGLVVHLGRAPPAEVVAALPALAPASGRVYLETPAARGPYVTAAGLSALFASIRAEVDPHLERFGLCVDTAHLWAGGVDVAARADAEAWLAALDVPAEALMFHLNDEWHALGSGRDEHAPLMRGSMWGGVELAASGLAAFVEYAAARGVPMVLERKGGSRLGFTLAQALESDLALLAAVADLPN